MHPKASTFVTRVGFRVATFAAAKVFELLTVAAASKMARNVVFLYSSNNNKGIVFGMRKRKKVIVPFGSSDLVMLNCRTLQDRDYYYRWQVTGQLARSWQEQTAKCDTKKWTCKGEQSRDSKTRIILISLHA